MTPPVYDVDQGLWFFDTTVFRNLEDAGLTGTVSLVIDGRGRIAGWVAEEIASLGIVPHIYGWQTVINNREDGREKHANLRRRWASTERRDRGEADSIALLATRRELGGAVFVTDDGTAKRTAETEGVRTTCTPQLLIALVRAGHLSADNSWSAYQTIDANNLLVHRSKVEEAEFRRLARRP